MRLSHVKLAQLIGTALLESDSFLYNIIMLLARHLHESPSAQPEVVSSSPAGPPETGQESARFA